jgi:L-threonylcarbamoyladenylate synthase
VILSGGLIVYPTETLYGIGADARNEAALRRVGAVKGREERKPMLVLVDSNEGLSEFASEVPDVAAALMRAFWPGPLTLVLRALESVPEMLTAGTGTIGVRNSPDPFCRDLIRRAGRAITSTSANRAGEPTPAGILGIVHSLGTDIDLYVDAGQLGSRFPSTVVDVSGKVPKILREGAIPGDQLLPFLHAG